MKAADRELFAALRKIIAAAGPDAWEAVQAKATKQGEYQGRGRDMRIQVAGSEQYVATIRLAAASTVPYELKVSRAIFMQTFSPATALHLVSLAESQAKTIERLERELKAARRG